MNFRQLTLRLEIGFWNLAIGLLSESTFLRSLVRWLYLAGTGRRPGSNPAFQPARALFWASAGLALGFFAGLLGGFLR
jgi:hypothetical protein